MHPAVLANKDFMIRGAHGASGQTTVDTVNLQNVKHIYSAGQSYFPDSIRPGDANTTVLVVVVGASALPSVRTARSRNREINWLNRNQEQYRGQWVVLEGHQVVAHGRDYASVRAEALRKGVEVPFIIAVPDRPISYHPMGL